jgi:N-acetylneuraminic acid mutarotase
MTRKGCSIYSLPFTHRLVFRGISGVSTRFFAGMGRRGTAGAICFVLALGGVSLSADAQTREWAWVGGSNMPNQAGIYGTLAVPAAGNTPGGRSGASTWTDSSGNFWLYGGGGYDSTGQYGTLDDMWELNPLSHEWTWMGGSSTLNCSGTTGSKQCGQTAIYGIQGTAAAGNTPGSRGSAATWTDSSGNFWLFGGTGFTAAGQGDLGDLWEFNPSTRQWTWMGGSTMPNQPGVYGMLGVPAAGNTPGSRDSVTTWTDTSGNFWLFGGLGYTSGEVSGPFNDLWKFSTSTHEWTWVSGSNSLVCATTYECGSQPGVYGTLGSSAAANTPGGRLSASGWADGSGNLWLFGGAEVNLGLADSPVYLNDVWEFNPSTSEWGWMGGSNTSNQPGVYGTLGVPAPGNIPGSRSSAFTWVDRSGNFWLLGGVYRAPFNSSQSTNFNDLWELNPTTSEWTWMGGSGTLDCSNNLYGCGQPASYGTMGFPAVGNDPGGRYSVAAWIDATNNLWLFGGWDNPPTPTPYLFLNDLWELGVAAPAPVFSLAAGTYTGPQTLTITDSSPGAVIYYTTDGSTPSPSSNIYSSALTLSHTATVTAFANVTGLMNSPLTTAAYLLQATPTVTATPSASSITTAQALTVAVSVAGGNGTATGSVTLSGGGYTSPATTLSGGSATINIGAGSLLAETDMLTVHYSPDTASSSIYTTASGAASVIVTVPVSITFALSNSGNIAISRGAATGNTGSSTISATPSGGFTGSVNLSCAISSAPANVVDAPTCSLSPAATAITGAGAVTSTLTIATTAPTSALNHPFQWIFAPASGIAFGCICLLGFPGRRARRISLVVLCALAATIAGSGCSGGAPSGSSGGTGGTTAGSYTVTVTGNSGSIAQSTSVSLTVTN